MAVSIVVAVAMHKPYKTSRDPVYLPLHVGAAVSKLDLGIQRDDSGDNISALNPSYSELTGLYWMWKNCDADYKGLVHYRRYLSSPSLARRLSKDPYSRIASRQELLEGVQKTGILLPAKRHYVIETVRSHYAHTMDPQHIAAVRTAVENRCPEYLKFLDKHLAERSGHILNMGVMRSDFFDSYCSYLFPLLEEIRQQVDDSHYDAFQKRYVGRVSEWLLDPWIAKNGLSYAELPLANTEPVNRFKKGGSFLMAKFAGKKYRKSF